MSKRPYVIKVTGRIFSASANNYAQDWQAGGIASLSTIDEENHGILDNSDYNYLEDIHTVDSNLILDNSKRAVPYAIYQADGGVCDMNCSELDGGITAISGYGPAIYYYAENMSEINKLLNIDIPEVAQNFYYGSLYVSTFSALELFLSDYILCGIFSADDCYDRAVSHFNLENQNDPSVIEKTILEKFEKMVFHRFDDVKCLYCEILHKDLLDTSRLNRMIHKRNNIVHRFFYTNKNRMKICEATKDDVSELMSECSKFTENLK